eukprot:scaffold26633_cov140-Isochrysis_galbana.AAC.1
MHELESEARCTANYSCRHCDGHTRTCAELHRALLPNCARTKTKSPGRTVGVGVVSKTNKKNL